MNTCLIDDCNNKPRARGWCTKHYQRWQAHGNPLTTKTLMDSNLNLHDKTHVAYRAMLQRCLNKNNQAYANYGGRGIKVCDRWLGREGFVYFVEDMGLNPPGLTLDRKDNEADYTPANCRWVSSLVQTINRRMSKTNTLGVVGVQQNKNGNYTVRIRVYGKRITVGTYPTIQEAAQARQEAEKQYHEPILRAA